MQSKELAENLEIRNIGPEQDYTAEPRDFQQG